MSSNFVAFQTGETEAKAQGQETNQMATYIMECGGMERIEQLQMHDNNSIYNKVGRMGTNMAQFAHFRESSGVSYVLSCCEVSCGSCGWLFFLMALCRVFGKIGGSFIPFPTPTCLGTVYFYRLFGLIFAAVEGLRRMASLGGTRSLVFRVRR